MSPSRIPVGAGTSMAHRAVLSSSFLASKTVFWAASDVTRSVRAASSADCHGQWPSISTTTDQLRKVRTKTSPPSIPILLAVSSSKMVRMTSAAIRNSSDSRSERPNSFLYAGYGSGTRVDNCKRKRREPKMIETTMMTTARSWIPCDENSIHSRTLLVLQQPGHLGRPAPAAEAGPVFAVEIRRFQSRHDVKVRCAAIGVTRATYQSASTRRVGRKPRGYNCHI
jgi:hypothetical protein